MGLILGQLLQDIQQTNGHLHNRRILKKAR